MGPGMGHRSGPVRHKDRDQDRLRELVQGRRQWHLVLYVRYLAAGGRLAYGLYTVLRWLPFLDGPKDHLPVRQQSFQRPVQAAVGRRRRYRRSGRMEPTGLQGPRRRPGHRYHLRECLGPALFLQEHRDRPGAFVGRLQDGLSSNHQ